MSGFQTAIAFFVFNRPQTTQQVFAVLRSLRPQKLLIVSDGPRPNHPDDQENCAHVQTIFETLDWDCELAFNLATENLGCSQRFATGLDWVFSQVEEAIILEDDCLPGLSFFRFCEELLEEYRDNPQVTQICGTNRLYEWKSAQQSYHFAYYGSAWGWATWKRAWNRYDHNRQGWHEEAVQAQIRQLIDDEEQFAYFAKTCEIDMWDYKWSFAQLSQAGLTIIPAINLVKNIGFSRQATHTKGLSLTHINSTFQPGQMTFPLMAPTSIAVDREYNQNHFQFSLGRPTLNAAEDIAARLLKEGNLISAYVAIQHLSSLYPGSEKIKSAQKDLLIALRQQKK